MYCPNCGGEFESPQEGLCPHCGHTIGAGVPAQQVPPAPPEGAPGGSGPGGEGEAPYCPFEDPSLGFFDGFVETIKQVFASPAPFFRRLPDTSDIGRPLVFYVIVQFLGALLYGLWNLVFLPLQLSMNDPDEIRRQLEAANIPPEMVDMILNLMSPAGGVVQVVVGVVMAVVMGVIIVFISTAIYHLLLMLVGGANREYGATFRVVCYANSVALLQIVPFCGQYISGLWALVLYIVGLTMVHRTNAWRAVIAVLLPIILCCLCCVGGTIGVIAMIAGAASSSGGP